MEHILYTCDVTEIKYQLFHLKKNMLHHFTSYWAVKRNQILSDPASKLHLLANLTPKFERANYIDQLENHNIRNSICRFRLSAHNLPVETQRFLNTPRHLRICPLCCSGIGDESHYIFKCQFHKLSDSISDIRKMVAQNSNLDQTQQLVNLLNDPTLNIMQTVGRHIKFVEDLFRDGYSLINS